MSGVGHLAAASVAELADLAPAWRGLERQAHPNVFLTFDWMHAWWSGPGHAQQPHVIAVHDEGGLAGVAPLSSSWAGFAAFGRRQRLQSAGCPISCRMGFLSRPGREHVVAEGVARFLWERRSDWVTLHLENLPADAPELDALARSFANGHVVERVPATPCPYLPVGTDWTAFLQSRSSAFRKRLHRRRRNFETRLGGRVAVCNEPDEIERALAFLFDQSVARCCQRNEKSAFADPRVRAFHLDVANRFLTQGRLDLRYLELSGTIAAVLYAFRIRDRYFIYNTAFDPRWETDSLGSVVMEYAIENAIATGASEIDFLRGIGEHKRRWTTEAREQQCLSVMRRDVAMVHAVTRLPGRLKRFAAASLGIARAPA